MADAEPLHDGEGPAAQTQEVPCGGQADHACADYDDPVGSIAHVVDPSRHTATAPQPFDLSLDRTR